MKKEEKGWWIQKGLKYCFFVYIKDKKGYLLV